MPGGLVGTLGPVRRAGRLVEREPDGAARARARVHPDAAAVAGDDAVGDGQADACAGEFALRVEAAKALEQVLVGLAIESRPLVTDAERVAAAGMAHHAGDPDAGRLAAG